MGELGKERADSSRGGDVQKEKKPKRWTCRETGGCRERDRRMK